jgi:hypothetical protein
MGMLLAAKPTPTPRHDTNKILYRLIHALTFFERLLVTDFIEYFDLFRVDFAVGLSASRSKTAQRWNALHLLCK